MTEDELLEIIARNKEAYIKEAIVAFDIIRQNRHSSVEPYEWLGPGPGPTQPAGIDCQCAGCRARFRYLPV